MAIFLLHGIIVDSSVRGALTHRSYVACEAFEAYLRQRAVPFGAWSADGPVGDVLTVDDATRAGADACLAARRLGHEVLFFVNPYQIASGQPYFFSLLSALLDARTATSVAYRGQRYDLSGAAGADDLRRAARAQLMTLPAAESYAAVLELSRLLGAAGVEVAAHERPLSLADLIALRDAGVRIENHGWSHVEIGALSDAQFAEHVVAGRDWLQRHLSVEARLYAVPFGATDVPARLQHWVADGYFLAGDRFPRGRCGPYGWNRRDLGVEMRAASRFAAYLAARSAAGT